MISLKPQEAAAYMTGHLKLNRFEYEPTDSGLVRLLSDLRCIQIDPLAPLLSNPDLVALARCRDYQQADIYTRIPANESFEHFAKERCLLPASAFPWYRDRVSETPWWRLKERLGRIPPQILESVLAEVQSHGPLTAAQLSDFGRVEPLDYNGWKGTAKMASMALEVLWLQCKVVVCGRAGRNKIYDVPQRALPQVAQEPGGDFGRWAIKERIEAAGLLPRVGGPHWSMLDSFRREGLPDQMVAEGEIQAITIQGANTVYYAPKSFQDRLFPEPDQHLRILGPLDPVLWFRPLIQHVFDFQYLWEVYKPVDQRRWGWYVCPLLHEGRFVGRLEGRVLDNCLQIDTLWKEPETRLDPKALDRALTRLAKARGISQVRRPKIPRSHLSPSRLETS